MQTDRSCWCMGNMIGHREQCQHIFTTTPDSPHQMHSGQVYPAVHFVLNVILLTVALPVLFLKESIFKLFVHGKNKTI